MIKVNNLNKYYNKGKDNEIHVINNATLEIKDTGLVAFLGKSGSGKTTLLNVIGGLDKAKGEIIYDDVTIKNYQVSKIDKYRKKNIGYIFQNYSLIHNQTVYENLCVAMNLVGIFDEAIIEERIKCSLTSVGMYKYRKRLAGTLSGGQQQRVAIARALVKNAKIIIADEPTGNLDSQNTVEVLNILKQISTTRLVLLVTHDVKLADFYADRIIELKDGVIINDYVNDERPDEYDKQDSKHVYLGDLNKEETNVSNLTVTKYSDAEMPNIELKIVYINGTIYLESPLSIKLIGANTPVKLVEGTYQKFKTEDIKTDYNFDFKETTKKKRNIKGFFKRLWLAIKSFFMVRNRTYFLYVAFVIIGMLMALCAYNIGKYTYVDTDNSIYDKNAYVITNADKYNNVDDKYFDILYNPDGAIEKIIPINGISGSITISVKTNLSEGSATIYTSGLYLSIDEKVGKSLILGSLPENDEFLIDAIVADRAIELFGKDGITITRDGLLGLDISGKKISGIVDTKAVAIYSNNVYQGGYKRNINDICEYYEEKPDVTIVVGENVNLDNPNECLMPLSEYATGNAAIGEETYLFYGKTKNKVVGFYTSDETNKILVSRVCYEALLLGEENDLLYTATANNTILSDGKLPLNNGEIVTPDILTDEQFKIGSTLTLQEKEYTVVGRIDSQKTGIYNRFGYSIKETLGQDRFIESDSIYVYTSDFSKTKDFVEQNGYTITNTFDYVSKESRRQTASFGNIFFIICLLIQTILFVYFIMRAKMISRIKDIGIYRALGARKRAIIKDFLIELIVLTTFTTLLGYVLGSYFIIKTLTAFNSIGDIFVINIKMIVLCGVGFYFLNIIFGLLPIFMLLKKTPSQIIAKYDI